MAINWKIKPKHKKGTRRIGSICLLLGIILVAATQIMMHTTFESASFADMFNKKYREDTKYVDTYVTAFHTLLTDAVYRKGWIVKDESESYTFANVNSKRKQTKTDAELLAKTSGFYYYSMQDYNYSVKCRIQTKTTEAVWAIGNVVSNIYNLANSFTGDEITSRYMGSRYTLDEESASANSYVLCGVIDENGEPLGIANLVRQKVSDDVAIYRAGAYTTLLSGLTKVVLTDDEASEVYWNADEDTVLDDDTLDQSQIVELTEYTQVEKDSKTYYRCSDADGMFTVDLELYAYYDLATLTTGSAAARKKGITLDEVINTLYAPYAYEPERVPVLAYSSDRKNSGLLGNAAYVKRYKELYGKEVIMKPLKETASKNQISYENGGNSVYLDGTRKTFANAAVESGILVAVYADNQFNMQSTGSFVYRYELTAALVRYGSLLACMLWALALVMLSPLVVVSRSGKWNCAMEFLAGNGMVLEARLLLLFALFGLSGYGAYRFRNGSYIGAYTLGVSVLAVAMLIAMLHQFVKNRAALTSDTLAGRLASYLANKNAKKRELYHVLGMGYHLQKNTLLFVVQLIAWLVIEVVLLLCYVNFGESFGGFGGLPAGVCYAVAAVLFLAVLVLALVHHMRFINNYVCGIEGIQRQLELFGQGDFETKIALPKQFYGFQTDEEFDAIKQGVLIAMESEMKSERMKIDLVTNVSHDIKTPLTSIINYVDLLADSGNLPQVEADYVKVLQRKSYRLRNMIQDLFDLSKATSGNLPTEFAELDFTKLVQQTLADMDEQIAISSLTVRCDLESELKIYSDGSRLYRVIQNLIVNVLKYAMDNSRVYVTLKQQGANAVLSIKNMSRQEMNFTKEQVLERFFRGDAARSTDGSGLGVAIANSFTQVCGGQFDIQIDADLFCAIVSIPLVGHELCELPDSAVEKTNYLELS